MDPLSALTAVLSITVTIKTWLDNNKKKNDSIRDLSTSVNLVYTILSPLQEEAKARHLDSSVAASLLSIGEVLSRIKDHLSLLKAKRMGVSKLLGFLNPSSVTDDLRDDARLLSQHLLAISLALHLSTFLAESAKNEEPHSKSSIWDTIKNSEVADFWRDMVGEKTLCISGKTFCEAISKWLNADISESFHIALLLRIDEFAIGGVTPSSIDRFVGNRTLNDAIDDLRKKSRISSQPSHAGRGVDPPWLVWIDDNPNNINGQIAFAEYMGVTVFILTSTASAKVWIDANEEHLRRRDDNHQIRFITDNARWESHTSQGHLKRHFLDLSAGEAILRFLRGRQYKAPVLVYTGASLPSTSYVLEYEQCGSTTSDVVCLGFIACLAHAVDNDRGWQTFDARHEIVPPSQAQQHADHQPSETRLSRFGDGTSTALFCDIESGGGSL